MKNIEHCLIIKVKEFWGIKSIDPPMPFHVFLEKNKSQLQRLLDKQQIIVVDEQGEEIATEQWLSTMTHFIRQGSIPGEAAEEEASEAENDIETAEFKKKINENLALIKKLTEEEEIKKILHKKIQKSLQESDSFNQDFLQKKHDHLDKQLDKINQDKQEAFKENKLLEKHLQQKKSHL